MIAITALIVSCLSFILVLDMRNRVRTLEQRNARKIDDALASGRAVGAGAAQPISSGLGSLAQAVELARARGMSVVDASYELRRQGWHQAEIEEAFANLPPVGTIAPSTAQFQPATPSVPAQPAPPDALESFNTWLQEDWMLKLGALLFLIGFGWLASYAFLNNWIGPMGRITLGIVAGVFILLLGTWRMRKYSTQGAVFLVLGSTTILLTVYAARDIYGFFTPLSALVVMFLSAAYVAAVSVQYRSRSLALASLIVAGIAPALTNSPSSDYIGLFAYLFVVILGVVWVVAITKENALTLAGVLLVTIYSMPHLLGLVRNDRDVLLLFIYGFAAVFFLTNTASLMRMRGDGKADLVAASANGLLLLAWIKVAAPADFQSLIISAWTVVFMVGAFVLYRALNRPEALYVYAGIGAAMLATATAAELEGPALTIAYTIESAVVILLMYVFTRHVRRALQTSLLLAGPVILSLPSIVSNSWRTSVLHSDFIVLSLLSLVFFAIGFVLLRPALRLKDDSAASAGGLVVLGSAYAFIVLWLSLHVLLIPSMAVMSALTIYTVIGLGAYFGGLFSGKHGVKMYGAALVGLVVVRLLIVDVWSMELSGRIITFFVIGALLMSTAFIERNTKATKAPLTTPTP